MKASARLKSRVDARKPEWSINRLATELQERNVRGASYGSIRNYYHGKAEPPLEVLFAAADLFGESREWWAHGKGHPTEVHAADAAGHDAAMDRARAESGDRLSKAFEEGFSEILPLLSGVTLFPRALLLAQGKEIAKGIMFHQKPGANLAGDGAEAYRIAGRMLAECMVAPLRILNAERALEVDPYPHPVARAYISAIAHAVTIVAFHAQAPMATAKPKKVRPPTKKPKEGRR